jgi:tetratricopeptide (TPR) repeat protein
MADCFITSYVNQYTVQLYTDSTGVSADDINDVFSSTYAYNQDNLDYLAGTILGQGIDYFTNKNYDQAIKSFKSAAALSPFSDNSSKAYDYMGQAYVKLENYDAAIKTYEEASGLYPTDDTFPKALGDIYMKEGSTEEAIKQYMAAANIDPSSADNRYSLGQSYLKAGELDKAKEQFNRVVGITPGSAAGYYGLGQVARSSGDMTNAVTQLKKAISVNHNFELAYVELGYTYADQGDFTNANEELAVLNQKGSSYETTLSNYITEVTKPQITYASSSDFNTSLGAKTKVSALDSTLSTAGNSKLFSMSFTFSKVMDEASIINPYSWKISRATLRDNGGIYNSGLPVPATEASISNIPSYISYNSGTETATIHFRVYQNANADATIDPKDIVFKFSGVDAYGEDMDTSADEYSGFSNIA